MPVKDPKTALLLHEARTLADVAETTVRAMPGLAASTHLPTSCSCPAAAADRQTPVSSCTAASAQTTALLALEGPASHLLQAQAPTTRLPCSHKVAMQSGRLQPGHILLVKRKMLMRRTLHQRGVTLDASRFSRQCWAGSAGAWGNLSGAIGSWGLGGWHLILCAPIC